MKTKTQPTNAGYVVIYNQIKQTRKEYLKKNNFISKKSWYFLTKSEMKVINKNKIAKPMGKAKFMESIVQHKLNKWIKNNPTPTDKQNLFYEEFTKEWKNKKEIMLQHYRDVVIAIYYKLKIYGRFNTNKQGYPKLIALIPNKTNELFDNKTVNDLNKDSVLLKRAKIVYMQQREKNPKLIACLLEDVRGKCGRIIIA